MHANRPTNRPTDNLAGVQMHKCTDIHAHKHGDRPIDTQTCTHTHAQTHTQNDTQTDTQTRKQTDTETHKHADRQMTDTCDKPFEVLKLINVSDHRPINQDSCKIMNETTNL